MFKLKNFFRNYWKVLLFFVLALPLSIFAAGTGLSDMTSTWGGGFVIDKAAGNRTFTIHGETVTVGDTSALPGNLFIPSKTQAELDSFLASPIGQSVASVGCTPTYTCDSAYCGDDGCGTICVCSGTDICVGNACEPDVGTPGGCPADNTVKVGGACDDGAGGDCRLACISPATCDSKTFLCVK